MKVKRPVGSTAHVRPEPEPPVKRPRGRPRKDGSVVPPVPRDVARELYVCGIRRDGKDLPEDWPREPSLADVANLLAIPQGTLQNIAWTEGWTEQRDKYWAEVWEQTKKRDAAYLAGQAVQNRRSIFDVARKFVAIADKIADANQESPNVKDAATAMRMLAQAAQATDLVACEPKAIEPPTLGITLGQEDWLAMRLARRGGPTLDVGIRRND